MCNLGSCDDRGGFCHRRLDNFLAPSSAFERSVVGGGCLFLPCSHTILFSTERGVSLPVTGDNCSMSEKKEMTIKFRNQYIPYS